MHFSRSQTQYIFIALALMLALVVIFHSPQPALADDGNLCADCHGDQERLKELTQRWSKLYVDPAKYSAEVHGGLACVDCHGGDPTKDVPEEACKGIAQKDPAAPETVTKVCGECHEDITARHLDSIHVTLNGIRLSLHDFEGEEHGEQRFQESCSKCHASCADCHMNEPGAHGVLQPRVESHSFTPDVPTQVCVACHDGTGTSYTGVEGDDERPPSKMAEAGMDCMACHVEEDVHGTGHRSEFVTDNPKPECEECHEDPLRSVKVEDGLRVAPQYDEGKAAHQEHDGELSCEACHTGWYESCWNCHEGREARKTIDVYLAVNPLTGKVHTAAHTPATAPDWGSIPEEIGGGWAIKSRHSWGVAKPCEYCHTDESVYMNDIDRQAPFVGVWGESRENATFVPEELVQLIMIDEQALEDSAHSDVTCNDCHDSLGDETCSECHATSEKSGETVLPADGDWSRQQYITARENLRQIDTLLEQLAELRVSSSEWSERRENLRTTYLQAANDFHAEPGTALSAMTEVAQQTGALLVEIEQAQAGLKARHKWMMVGFPLAAGLLGVVVMGFVVFKPNKKR